MVLKKEIALQIKDLLKENSQGLSITDIVRVVKINRNTAGRYLENLLISGQVEMRRRGWPKFTCFHRECHSLLFYLSHQN
jgi:predicted transcriptional regulator